MKSIDVLKTIIRANCLEKDFFQFISHPVAINWRQRHQTALDKISELSGSLTQHKPTETWIVKGCHVLSGDFNAFSKEISDDHVISACSIVYRTNDNVAHIPMMNFHPHKDVTTDHLISLIQKIMPGHQGFILNSGRFCHFWGVDLLDEHMWVRFNCQFLMPTIVISERYVGHSLYRGYNALRLTSSTPHKPLTPYVIKTLEYEHRSAGPSSPTRGPDPHHTSSPLR